MPAWSWAVPEAGYQAGRVRCVERMDRPGLPAGERALALAGLERLSRWPGQRGPLLRGVLELLGPPPPRRLRLIEVGAGSGSLSRWVAAELAARGYRAEVLATDRRAVAGVRRLDALSSGLPEADVYFSNLLLHHLDDPSVSRMLRRQARASRLGLAHYDLHRHRLHYHAAAGLLRLAGLPAIVQHDGPLSIQQGYTRAELEALAAGLPHACVRWRVPFRWLLTWKR